MKSVYIIIGGFLGSVFRFFLGRWLITSYHIPIGTLCVNVLGCFFLGWFLTYVHKRKAVKEEIVLMIGTGMIGSFTTFSTFSVETMQFIINQQLLIAIYYNILSIGLGLFTVYLGYKLAAYQNDKEGVKQ